MDDQKIYDENSIEDTKSKVKSYYNGNPDIELPSPYEIDPEDDYYSDDDSQE